EPLRLVELQAAIESHLKAAFSLPTTASTRQLLETVEQSGRLPAPSFTRLQRLFQQLQQAADAMTSGVARRSSLSSTQARLQFEEILKTLELSRRRTP